MLAQIMGLPFKRDALEKTIRDALRRGKQPSLPMLGQLVAGMGLQAYGAKIPSALCTRMNVPCLMAWDDGFGVVVQSNANGMLMAHPRLGWVELTPNQIEESAPDGIELILVDRTSTTPDRNSFGWFYQPSLDPASVSTGIIICGASHSGKPAANSSDHR